MTSRRRVCDVGELSTMADLNAWATAHGAEVTYRGSTLEGRAVYGATRGPVTRVVVVPGRDPHPHPLSWESPLERLPASPRMSTAEMIGRALAAPVGTLDGPAGEMHSFLLAAIRSAL
ncbi:hypothetical protein Q8791_29135 [Nocardiopsis sp. CT-R113]|uniref:Uncharacterized protein n=1 Tax=Nocardiopsis codii TaxID=3065942 RepID=A0ABU7KGH1_9ACTN|nr:hypothetical protein [Nocardiopsis sp. CT-R113]MEE2041297.1 hypothetical protein [Nocardiopsis sp. CT-R113]